MTEGILKQVYMLKQLENGYEQLYYNTSKSVQHENSICLVVTKPMEILKPLSPGGRKINTCYGNLKKRKKIHFGYTDCIRDKFGSAETVFGQNNYRQICISSLPKL